MTRALECQCAKLKIKKSPQQTCNQQLTTFKDKNILTSMKTSKRQKHFNVNDLTSLFLWKYLVNLTWGILLPYSTHG